MRTLQGTVRALTGEDTLSKLTGLMARLKALRADREGYAATITSLSERAAPLSARVQTNSSAAETLTALIEVVAQVKRCRQDTVTRHSLDKDHLALTTNLEHQAPLSNEENWGIAADRARLKAEAWLEHHESVQTTHSQASGVEQWPDLLKFGADKAPRLSAITDELATQRSACSVLEQHAQYRSDCHPIQRTLLPHRAPPGHRDQPGVHPQSVPEARHCARTAEPNNGYSP